MAGGRRKAAPKTTTKSATTTTTKRTRKTTKQKNVSKSYYYGIYSFVARDKLRNVYHASEHVLWFADWLTNKRETDRQTKKTIDGRLVVLFFMVC